MTEVRKAGRRPGDPEVTRTAILNAARAVFAEAGFDRATIRSIAAQAEVDPALIHHHFGTKQDLFAAAHELPASPAALVSAVVAAAPEDRAEMIIRAYMEVLSGPGSPMVSLLRAAATNDAAARMLREFIHSLLIENADRLCSFPDARLRVTLLVSHIVGVIFARLILRLPEANEVELEDLVPILVPMADRYLNSPDLTAF